MKITLEQIAQGMEEIIIRYKEKTSEITEIVSYLQQREGTIPGTKDGQQFLLRPQQIIYLESVEGVTFLYTESAVYKTTYSLTDMEARYGTEGFFRCSKSMVINIYRIRSLKSEPGNRINAEMDNGEHVIISRRYAKELRIILKGEEA